MGLAPGVKKERKKSPGGGRRCRMTACCVAWKGREKGRWFESEGRGGGGGKGGAERKRKD